MEKTSTKTIASSELLAQKPAWAETAIIAELDENQTDLQTDYFNHRTVRTVFLAWSKHARDVFSEMRKAAALFEETAHLGPHMGDFRVSVVFTNDVPSANGRAYYTGSRSHWHGENLRAGLSETEAADVYEHRCFDSRAAAEAWIAEQPAPGPISFDGHTGTFRFEISETKIEHREKYSMGHGYFLKRGGTHSDGWSVKKVGLWRLEGSYTKDRIEVIVPSSKPASARSVAPGPVADVTVTFNREREGIELRFPSKPGADVLDRLKADGWRWSRFGSCWWHRDTQAARNSAAEFVATPSNVDFAASLALATGAVAVSVTDVSGPVARDWKPGTPNETADGTPLDTRGKPLTFTSRGARLLQSVAAARNQPVVTAIEAEHVHDFRPAGMLRVCECGEIEQ